MHFSLIALLFFGSVLYAAPNEPTKQQTATPPIEEQLTAKDAEIAELKKQLNETKGTLTANQILLNHAFREMASCATLTLTLQDQQPKAATPGKATPK